MTGFCRKSCVLNGNTAGIEVYLQKNARLHISVYVESLMHVFEVYVYSPSSILVYLTNAHKAASLADSSPVSAPLTLRVEPKQKSGIRYRSILKPNNSVSILYIATL